jgi:hypothetical protein
MAWSFKELFWQSAELPQPAEPARLGSPGGVNAAHDSTRLALAVLRDVRGVLGSIAVNLEGQLLAADLPAEFSEPTAQRLGMRLSLLREVASLERGHGASCLLTCSTYQLQIHGMPWGTLGVLVAPGETPPSLDVPLKLIAARTQGAPLTRHDAHPAGAR